MVRDKENWESDAYKILDMQGPQEDGVEGVFDIPQHYISTKNYAASLAHKANHSFEPNSTRSLIIKFIESVRIMIFFR